MPVPFADLGLLPGGRGCCKVSDQSGRAPVLRGQGSTSEDEKIVFLKLSTFWHKTPRRTSRSIGLVCTHASLNKKFSLPYIDLSFP